MLFIRKLQKCTATYVYFYRSPSCNANRKTIFQDRSNGKRFENTIITRFRKWSFQLKYKILN